MSRICSVLVLVVVLALPAAAAAATNPQLTNTRLKSNFSSLRSLIKTAPGTTVGRRFESRLLSQASLASRMISRGDPCGARTPLRALRAAVKSSGPLALGTRAEVIAESLNAEAILLSRPSASSCGGAKRAPGTQVATRVLAASPQLLKLRVTLPTPIFEGVGGDGKAFAQLNMNGLQAVGNGTPGVPGFQRWFAIPQGAKVSIKTDATSSFVLPATELAPAQPEPVDQDPTAGPDVTSEDPAFKRPAFQFSSTEYRKTAPFPARGASVGAAGPSRYLNLARLNIAGAQFLPGRRQLKVNTAFEVTINFTGGTGKFGTTELIQPENKLWQQLYAATVVNYADVIKNLVAVNLNPCGEDVLIITTPQLRVQADRLATQKRARGYTTTVFETGSAPVGSTYGDIKAFVKSRFNNGNCSKKIDYLILFGKNIPHFTGADGIPTDYEYSLMFDGWWIPSFAVGRIPADSLASATTIVDKTIQYESSPPADPGYYQKAMIAGEFQWDDGCGGSCSVNREARTFITAAEAVRNGATARGKVVDRLYKKQAGATPKKFNDGSSLPGALLESNGFAWTANNTNIANAINDGRFLLFHRDHGGPNGWSTPGFNTTDIAGLSNAGELPLVWSINCSTGQFDGAGFSFAEAFVRKSGGGAAAVIAASRVSPSLANTHLAKALAHTAFRNVLPGFPLSEPVLEIGDALNLAKLYLIFTYTPSVGGDGASDTVHKEMHLYNVFGDPTLKLYLAKP